MNIKVFKKIINVGGDSYGVTIPLRLFNNIFKPADTVLLIYDDKTQTVKIRKIIRVVI